MTIVQIGTNVANDTCSDFVKRNSRVIDCVHLVEPFANNNEQIRQAYEGIDNVFIHNVAISPDPLQFELTLHYPENHLGSAHSSSSLSHLHVHGHRNVSSITVPCYTLGNFIDWCEIEVCDRLYIDTEGLDCQILLEFDPLKYDVKYIEYEIIHADGAFKKGETYQKCVDKLKALGYTIAPSGDYNECAVRLF